MKIHILPPVGITRKGIREGNEDAIYPDPGSAQTANRYFIVCDGVGGSNKGEVASRLACDMFHEYFKANQGQEINHAFMSKALEYTEASFDGFFRANPHAMGMATTIALAYFHDDGVEVAWCGDSRVYHIRKDKILYRTDDHSAISELVRSGTITEEQASKHPSRNVITRAIQGTSQKKTSLDTHRITDIQPGDYIFICSDGVWEPVSDQMLIGILSGKDGNAQKLDFIMQECQENSKDNYSCYLIQVKHVEDSQAAKGPAPGQGDTVIAHKNLPGEKQANELNIHEDGKDRRKKKFKNLLTVAIIVALAIILYFPASYVYNSWVSNQEEKEAWQEAKDAYTIASYEAYLLEYPDGRFTSEAQEGKRDLKNQEAMASEDLAWQQAQYANTIALYEAYLDKYPNGRYASDALEGKLILELEQEAADLADESKAKERRQRQEEARLAAERAEKEQRQREDQAWQQAQDANTIAAYEAYLGEYPRGRYASQAREVMDVLEQKVEAGHAEREVEERRQREDQAWQQAKDANTIAGYEAYLEEYPDGRYVSQAQENKLALEEGKARLDTAEHEADEEHQKQIKAWEQKYWTQVVKVTNPATGRTWMDRNLGASRVAISSSDAQAYGDLYQWGRATDGHQQRNSDTTSTMSSSDTPGHSEFILGDQDWVSPQHDNLWQWVNGVNNPCPPGYRLPTESEWQEERQSWSSNDAAGAFASPLKLPVAGLRHSSDGSLSHSGDGSLNEEVTFGYYWSSNVYDNDSRYLFFGSADASMENSNRAAGLAVRCIKD